MDNRLRLAPAWQSVSDQHEQAEREFISIADIWAFLKQHYRLILGSVGAALLCAWFYVVTTNPVYTAQTQMLIEPKFPQVLQQQQMDVNLTLDTAQVESQIAVMRSEKIAMLVIKQLGLKENPAFLTKDVRFSDRLIKFGKVLASMIGIDPAWLFGGTEKSAEPSGPVTEFARDRLVITAFTGGLDVRRVGVSYAIDISFRSPDPEIAAKVANTTAEAFVREQLDTKAAAAREGGQWLEQRLNQLRVQMNDATQIAQEFRARHDYEVGRPMGSADVDAGNGTPTLEELEVAADTYRKMYESFLQAYTNSVSQQSYPVADARVITPATPPLRPSEPRRKLALAFGGFAGLMLGIALAFLRHMLDRSVRTPRQLREEFGLTCIGELPQLPRKGALDAIALAPSSTYANGLRAIKTAIGLADSARPLHCIGIASALRSDGKSTFASNLAMLYSMFGLRTLVIDADVFHSVLSRNLLPAPEAGSGPDPVSGTIDQHVVLTKNATFDMVPSYVADARNLLVLKNMRDLLPELQSYDFVIVDLPPLTSGADRLSVASLLDGVIVVAEWGRTPVDMFSELVRSLHAGKASIVGAVLTNVRTVTTSRYAGHGAKQAN